MFSGEREADVESESRATGKARVSRSTTSLCLPENVKKWQLFYMEAVIVTSAMTPTPLNLNNFIC